jgi:hypothetical protein
MSTEHQQYSTENQLDRIKEYAARRNMSLVRIFEDAGKSGLNVRGRDSLRKMIEEVEKGIADFKCILAYDVSRWGRFQDADESGYYEYICKRAGISRLLRRAVRERRLADLEHHQECQTFDGWRIQPGAFDQGFPRRLPTDPTRLQARRCGGLRTPPDADRSVRSTEASSPSASTKASRPTESCSLGPDEEVANVRWIYRAFLDEHLTEREIAERLRPQRPHRSQPAVDPRDGCISSSPTKNTSATTSIHRTSFKLKRKHVQNPPDMWIRVKAAFPAIVSTEDFLKVQEIILARAKRFTDEEMLERLRQILAQHGRISGLLIDECDDLPSSASFRHRFGSLVRAYQLIGYTPDTDFSFIEVNRFLRQKHPEIVQEVISQLTALGVHVDRNPANELLVLDRELVVSLVLSRCLRTPGGASRW